MAYGKTAYGKMTGGAPARGRSALRVLAAAVAAAGGLHAASFAEDANEPRQLGVMDADKDGTVTRAELTAYSNAAFDDVDANDDGAVSLAEMKADAKGALDETLERRGAAGAPRRERLAAQLAARAEAAAAASFETLDADKSGSVSPAEYLAGYEPAFEKADANDDDAVDAGEMRAHLKAQREAASRNAL